MIDMYNNEILCYSLKKALRVASSIDELIEKVQEELREQTKNKIVVKDKEIQRVSEGLRIARNELREAETSLSLKKTDIIDKYTRIADDYNRQHFGKTSDDLIRNDTAIRVYAYLLAFNQLNQGMFQPYWSTPTKNQFSFSPRIPSLRSDYSSDYHPCRESR